ncbi:acylphosphatase [candidate division KSB1 bacterium]|nr:MAG: acylphosphatase [candidate division KSB1 bacterium]
MADIRAHIVVSGRVQGVGFRYFVRSTAKNLGLKGWVKNKVNGDVEIVAEGIEGMINELIKMLPVGNTMARVTDIHVTKEKCKYEFEDFSITF